MAKKRRNKRDKPKYVAVVPVGQKFVKAKPESSTKPEDRVRLAYRLLFTLDDALRTLMKRRGELSMYVLEALDSADFQKMPLVDINLEIKAPDAHSRQTDHRFLSKPISKSCVADHELGAKRRW